MRIPSNEYKSKEEICGKTETKNTENQIKISCRFQGIRKRNMTLTGFQVRIPEESNLWNWLAE